MTEKDLFDRYAGKRIAFITTKNLGYIRNSQELDLISRYGREVKVFGSNQKNYFLRIAYVWLRVLFSSFRSYDIVFVGFAPQLVCPFFFWKFPCEVHIDFFISLYDTFVNDRKVCRPDSITAGILRCLDKKAVNTADYIICDTRAHGTYFHDEFGAKLEKEVVLYLCANPRIYYPREVARKEVLKDKYVVLYFGSILPLQGVEVILDCVGLLEKNPNIFFQIIGPVKGDSAYCRDNAEFIPWLEEEKLAEYIAAADLCLAGHFNAGIEKARRTIPGKAYIYEAMEKPMILGDNPANRELFVEDRKHFFVEMGNADSLARKIEECYAGCLYDKEEYV